MKVQWKVHWKCHQPSWKCYGKVLMLDLMRKDLPVASHHGSALGEVLMLDLTRKDLPVGLGCQLSHVSNAGAHYYTVIRRPCDGQLTQLDFGPVGGDIAFAPKPAKRGLWSWACRVASRTPAPFRGTQAEVREVKVITTNSRVCLASGGWYWELTVAAVSCDPCTVSPCCLSSQTRAAFSIILVTSGCSFMFCRSSFNRAFFQAPNSKSVSNSGKT